MIFRPTQAIVRVRSIPSLAPSPPVHDPTPLTPSHRDVVEALKRRHRATVAELAQDLDLNVETLREHLRTLEGRDLVQRIGQAARGPGRPRILYALTERAEALFPQKDGELLHGLASFLVAEGHTTLLRRFYETQSAERRREALDRVAGLRGKARLAEVMRILAEMGYMPTLERDGGAPQLRLCHCPLRTMVAATHIPCRAELALLRDLLGTVPQRVSFIPDGADACTYRLAVPA